MLGPTQISPPSGSQQAQDHAQQHRLARAVRPDDADSLAVHDRAAASSRMILSSKALSTCAQLDRLGAAAHLRAELQAPSCAAPAPAARPCPCGRSGAACCRACLMWRSSSDDARPELEARDRRFQPLDLLLLRRRSPAAGGAAPAPSGSRRPSSCPPSACRRAITPRPAPSRRSRSTVSSSR